MYYRIFDVCKIGAFFSGLNENIKEALTNLCQRQGVSAGKKLAYLNAFVKLIRENEDNDFGYSVEQLFCW